MPPATSERDAVGRVLLFALFLSVLAAAAGTQALLPLYPEFKAALGVGDTEVRSLTAAYTIGYGVAGLLFGPLADRLGRAPLLHVALPIVLASNAALLAQPDFTAFLVLRLVAGLATGGLYACVIALASDAIPFARRGRAMTFVTAGSFVAFVLGMPAALVLARWRLTGVFGALALIATLAWLLLLPALRRLPRPPRGEARVFRPLEALTGRSAAAARAALAVTFLNTLAAFAVIGSFADHLVGSGMGGDEQREVFFLVLGVSALPGVAWAAAYADRVGPRRLVLIALAGSLLTTPALLVPDSFAWLCVAVAPLALIQSMRQGPFTALLTELVPARLRATLVGMNGAASGLGIAAGNAWGGAVYARAGFTGSVVLSLAALVLSLILFAAFVRLGPTDAAFSTSAPGSRPT